MTPELNKRTTGFRFALFILFLQSGISIYWFSQVRPDGGMWPFVFLILGLMNWAYAKFSLKMVDTFGVRRQHVVVATVLLAVTVFTTQNFARLFGPGGLVVSTGLQLGVLGTDAAVYALYVIFAFLPVATKPRG